MDVKRKLTYIFRLCLPLLLLLNACDDMEDKPFTSSDITGDPTETDTAELYALCEGLFNQNNSSLMRFSFNNQRMVRNYFKTINHRGLGDTANDLAIYGSKIYIVANVSSTIEIVDFQTGNSLKQIQMLTENGNPREPRYIAFHKEKAYVCSYDGTVARIDTASLTIDAMTTVGRNPDGICVQDDKLYVSNSGGLDHASGLGVDNTVSVVDIATFKETDKIIVGPNPGKIIADTKGYEITYYRPEPANQNVSWKDNQGNEGEILRNSFHNQESYYPVWIQENEITFRGTRLKDNAVPENGLWVGYCYPWGYADNHRNDKEGSNFKIDWAIDSNGESIVLDCIDFVKIMTAVNQDAGQMGEISTEVTTVENLHFKN